MARELDVWLLGERAGVLAQSDDGAQSFAYEASWLAQPKARAISLSLPLRKEPFDDRTSRAFFGGLLPDGEARARLARLLGRSARNEFALLEIVGRECAGALSIVPRGEQPPDDRRQPIPPLGDAELAAILRDLPRRPLHVGGEMRLSLAGAQDKLPVAFVDGRIVLPLDGRPSTHILKPAITGLEGTVVNELFCLRLAEALGLRVARASLLRVDDLLVLSVERFDRRESGDGRMTRVHQEDFCQALGVPAELKYQTEGGPNLARLFKVLRDHAARPAVDVLALLRAVVFGYLIGNADAHAKNFALLHAERGIELAPLYDQMCTLVYPNLSRTMAMRIGSAKTFDEVDHHAWDRFARDCGLATVQVRRTHAEFAGRCESAIEAVRRSEAAFTDSGVIQSIVDSMRERVAGLR